MPSHQHLKEYFDFASKWLEIVPYQNLLAFIMSDGKGLALKIFELVKHQQPESLSESFSVSLVGLLSLLKFFVPFESSESQ